MSILNSFLSTVNAVFVILFIFIAAIKFLQTLIEMLKAGRERQKNRILDFKAYMGEENMIPISIIVPICEEDRDAISTIDSLMEMNYDHMEIIVVNDGCGEAVNTRVIGNYELGEIEHAIKRTIKTAKLRHIYYNKKYPKLLYVEKVKGGLNDAVNAGINISQCPMFTVITPGMEIDKDALLKLSFEFFKDSSTVVSSGITRIDNNAEHENTSVKQGSIGYSKGVKLVECINMTAADFLNREASCELYSKSGMFALFQKQAVMDCNGFSIDSQTSQYEMFLRIQEDMYSREKDCRIVTQRDVLSMIPEDSTGDGFKRYSKWQKGVTRATFSHLKALRSPFKYKSLSLKVAYNLLNNIILVIFEALSYITLPLALIMNQISIETFLLIIGLYFGLRILNNISAARVDQQMNECYITPSLSSKIILYSILEALGYHQIVVLIRAVSTFGAFEKKKVVEKEEEKKRLPVRKVN